MCRLSWNALVFIEVGNGANLYIISRTINTDVWKYEIIFRVEQDISLVHFAHSWHTLSYFRTFMYYSLYNNLGSANIEPLDKYMSNLLLLLIFLISLLLICCLINFLLNLFYDLEDAPVLIYLNDWAVPSELKSTLKNRSHFPMV